MIKTEHMQWLCEDVSQVLKIWKDNEREGSRDRSIIYISKPFDLKEMREWLEGKETMRSI